MSRPPHPTALLLTALDVARLLRVSERSVWRMASRGALPRAAKFSGVRGTRWLAADIRAYVRRMTRRRK